MEDYKVIAESDESTVVAAYTPRSGRSANYQSESELEAELIRILCGQGYEHLPLHGEADLLSNLRARLEELNRYRFTEKEWKGFLEQTLANPNDGVLEKTTTIQTDCVKVLKRDDGSHKNICLFDKKNLHTNNRLQVVNQYAAGKGARSSRYDVTILVNGLPLVHIELKRRGVSLKEAFNQIRRYQEESFWAGSGLFEYIQVFVISNGTETKYYSNTARDSRVREADAPAGKGASRKAGDSFEFTSYWADAKNRRIPDLVDFAKTFLAQHTILNILAKYCVLATEQNGRNLMVMRPYQIVATERILERIRISAQYNKTGTLQAGGYIWHTTGSGKTLTSFKTAQLATGLDCVDKVLFVVDRKDLDSQTIREYEKFEKGCVSENKNTRDVQRQLEDPARKIIVTTIQKLSCFIAANKGHEVYRKRCVIIFDECHRSQFGEMHARIVNAFRHCHLFGFTGTPIFAAQAGGGAIGRPKIMTTAQTFGDLLHSYTIVDAIGDHNVLPFRISYINTVRQKEGVEEKEVAAIDEERIMGHPERIRQVVAHILRDFDHQTRRNICHDLKGKRVRGFNAMFAVSSIPMAMKYYDEFQRQLAEGRQDLAVATIFSRPPNGDDQGQAAGLLPEEDFDTAGLDKTAKDFLERAIHDYNKRFHANYSARDGRFESYYKDLSEQVKNRRVDLLIVVNMFLTGFDAKTLNTLWVDKNLKYHGLLQAFSRTNRIFNAVKAFGNVICFRNLKRQADEAIALFGDKDAGGVVFIRPFQDYWRGYDDPAGKHQAGYVELVEELTTKFPLEGGPVTGESRQREFIRLFGSLISLRNLLASFQEFKALEEDALPPRDLQDYKSLYLDLYDRYRGRNDAVKEDIADDVEFEIELIRQEEVNVDYILLLVEKYHQSNCRDKELLTSIQKTVDATPQLRSKKELIEEFVERINLEQDPLFAYGARDVPADWRRYVLKRKEQDLQKIIDDESLRPRETRKFVENCFRNDALKTTGTAIDDILPRMSRFSKGPGGPSRAQKKESVVQRLRAFFEKYLGLGLANAAEKAPESTPEEKPLLAAEEEGPYGHSR